MVLNSDHSTSLRRLDTDRHQRAAGPWSCVTQDEPNNSDPHCTAQSNSHSRTTRVWDCLHQIGESVTWVICPVRNCRGQIQRMESQCGEGEVGVDEHVPLTEAWVWISTDPYPPSWWLVSTRCPVGPSASGIGEDGGSVVYLGDGKMGVSGIARSWMEKS
ncbi:hypothetical protein C2845_PM13G11900 [Panicum miliaceum]|uniref:Uncharacterized protein n=1 Tax=Panicum miliaceum TaxID=4540 RepID=A0A3L6RJN4_PANMI|nr:hypothetical protein C2845_PM13G11900 [Panicum miliaceum]